MLRNKFYNEISFTVIVRLFQQRILVLSIETLKLDSCLKRKTGQLIIEY